MVPEEWPYDRERRNALIDRFYADALTLSEARELKSYVDRDVAAMKRAGRVGPDLTNFLLLQSALWAVAHLLEESAARTARSEA